MNKKFRFELINAEETSEMYGDVFCSEVVDSLKYHADNVFMDYNHKEVKKMLSNQKKTIIEIPDIKDNSKVLEIELKSVWYSVIRVELIAVVR